MLCPVRYLELCVSMKYSCVRGRNVNNVHYTRDDKQQHGIWTPRGKLHANRSRYTCIANSTNAHLLLFTYRVLKHIHFPL